MVSFVLAHSPLTGPAAWGALPDALRDQGHDVLVLDIVDDQAPPYAVRFVATAAAQIAAADPPTPLVLVAHSGAGYLLPQLGFTQRAARRPVGGYVFLDAGIPAPRPSTRLDLLVAEDPAMADDLGVLLNAGGRFPPWTDDDLREVIPDDAVRAAVVGSLRPRGRDFFTELLPFPTGDVEWPDAPCGLLQTSVGYAATARSARSRGWPVIERESGHFAACVDPHGVARDLLALVAQL
ncbi:MAG: hypothetical protein ABJA93_04560 [Sporichthyaceae bacterium]